MSDISYRELFSRLAGFNDRHWLATQLYKCSSHLFFVLQGGPTSDLDSAIKKSLRTQAQRFSLWGSSFDADIGGLDERLHDLDRLKQVLLPMLGTLAEKLVLLARQLDREEEVATAISLTKMFLAEVPNRSINNDVESTFMPISSLDDLSSSDSSDSDISHPSERLELIADIRSCNDCLFGLGCVLDDSAESVFRHSERRLVRRGFPILRPDPTSKLSQSSSDLSNPSRHISDWYTREPSSILQEPGRLSSITSGNRSQLRPYMYKQSNVELQRHTKDDHATSPTRKVWICEDHSPDQKLLAHCKNCTEGKMYGAFFDAVEHLRRVHSYTPEKGSRDQGIWRNKKGNDKGFDDPMMHTLFSWIREVTETVNLKDSVSILHGKRIRFRPSYLKDFSSPKTESVDPLTSFERWASDSRGD